MLTRVLLAVIVLFALHAVLGAAATLAMALLLLIIAHGRMMVWEANQRNNVERKEFKLVNDGEKEPDPHFLESVWNA